jgi:hypothetical protein
MAPDWSSRLIYSISVWLHCWGSRRFHLPPGIVVHIIFASCALIILHTCSFDVFIQALADPDSEVNCRQKNVAHSFPFHVSSPSPIMQLAGAKPDHPQHGHVLRDGLALDRRRFSPRRPRFDSVHMLSVLLILAVARGFLLRSPRLVVWPFVFPRCGGVGQGRCGGFESHDQVSAMFTYF